MTMIASLGLVSGGLGLNLAAVFRRQYSLNQQIYSAAFSQCKYCMLRRLSMGSFSNYRIYNRRHLTSYRSTQNYYEVLGVNRSATSDDIKRAFLARSKELHPDRNPSTGSHTDFVKLNEAYSTLKSYESRKLYDQQMGFNIMKGNWQSSANSSYPESDYGGSMYYEFYNPSTGKIEWKTFNYYESRSTINRRYRERGYSQDLYRNPYNWKTEGATGNEMNSRDFSKIAVSYLSTFFILFAMTITFVGVHSRRDHRFRNMDYDRLMYLDAQRSQHTQAATGKPSNKEKSINERTLSAQERNS